MLKRLRAPTLKLNLLPHGRFVLSFMLFAQIAQWFNNWPRLLGNLGGWRTPKGNFYKKVREERFHTLLRKFHSSSYKCYKWQAKIRNLNPEYHVVILTERWSITNSFKQAILPEKSPNNNKFAV